MDPFIIQLAIIFVPGMIWERIDALFVQKYRPSQFDILRRSFAFGLLAYIFTFSLYKVLGIEFKLFELSKDGAIISIENLYEIVVASISALILSIPYTWVINRRYHYRILQAVGATKRFGDEDVWDFTLNARNTSLKYVHLRDFDKRITYAGWVQYFSETEKIRELLLSDAILYDFDGNKILETPRIYLARSMDNIDLEFPAHDS